MSSLVLTNVYLEDVQKRALAKKAKADGTNLSVEMRKAVDAYLAGVSADDLRLLDEATRRAQIEIEEMNAVLDAGALRAERFFRDIEVIRSEPGAGAGA
jgi:hypothetical protein